MPALTLAKHLDTLARDLRDLHDVHFHALFGGPLSPHDFGLRLLRHDDHSQPPIDQAQG